MKVKVVYGCPCSGKSTYVKENIGDNDIVYDYDSLLRASTNRMQHLAAKHICHDIIIDLRQNYVEKAKKAGNIENFWFVCTWLSNNVREILDGLDIEEIFLQATQTECYERLLKDDNRPDKDEWKKIIDNWFFEHTIQGDSAMKKSDELKLQITAKREEVEKFQQAEEIDKAVKAADELNAMCDEFKIAVAKEKSDLENFLKDATPLFSMKNSDNAKLRNRAFNKILMNPLRNVPQPLTDDERNAYYNVTGSPGAPGQIESVDTRGGVLVSSEQIKTLQEFRQDYVALKDYVSVVQTTTTSGRWPIMPAQNLTFEPFVEMTDVAESDVSFTEATYTISDYGLIIPISNQLVDDADIDIISVIGRQLAEASVKTENQKILEPLNTLITGNTATSIAPATTISTYKALNTALFKTLDGVYEPASKIYVNQDTFLWLANLDDGQNRPLFQPDVTEPNKYRFRGKEVVVIPNTTLPNTTSGNDTFAPIFVGDMKSYLTFFERKGMELTTSREYLWRKYALALMGIIRFGVVVTDPNSMVALKVKL